MDVKQKVFEIIAEQAMLEPEDITPEATPESLGIDSLGLVESIFAIEEAFDISIPFNANEPEASDFDISSVQAIVAGIEKLISEKIRVKRVVITGAGTINPLGQDVPGTYAAMREGRCGISELEFRDVERLAIRIGGQVKGFEPDRVFNRQQLSLYDRFTQFTLLAARQAVAQSGLEFVGELANSSGVVLGTSGGGLTTQDENYRAVYEEGKNRVHPFVVPKLMNNAAASHVSMEFNLRGAVVHRGHRLCLVEPCHGAGVSDDPHRALHHDDHRRLGKHVVFWRCEGLGGLAGDVEGRLPPVLGDPQWDGAGRRRRGVCV